MKTIARGACARLQLVRHDLFPNWHIRFDQTDFGLRSGSRALKVMEGIGCDTDIAAVRRDFGHMIWELQASLND